MRKLLVQEPEEKSRINDNVVEELLVKLYQQLNSGNIIKTGSNANQTNGQESYVEILGYQVYLDPYAPYIYLDKNFSTPKKYFKAELEWYKSMDLSIIGHPMIEDNPTWNECCTKDDKKLINSNYGWCVFSEENGSQFDNALNILKKDPTSRNAIIMYNRPSIYKDYQRDGMRDMICTFYSQFFIREDKDKLPTLYMIHSMRSNDIKFGFICSDIGWSCTVYQNMYEELKLQYPLLQPGQILWTSNSMHLYSRHYDMLKNFIENKNSYYEKVLRY